MHGVFAEQRRISLTDVLRQATVARHGDNLWRPDWRPNSHSLAFGVDLRWAGLRMHLIMNAYWEPLDFDQDHTGTIQTAEARLRRRECEIRQ